jgi:hypothetical protein
MQTKSKIQLIIEQAKIKESYGEGIMNLLNKYTIKDNIFVCENGIVKEFINGYFEIHNEYYDIVEALKNCDINKESIRIINNKTFQTGSTYKTLSECSTEYPIMDVNESVYVR